MSATALAGFPAAHATYVWTPVVSAGADATSGTAFVDFSDDSSNPLPEHGYVVVHDDRSLTCGRDGGPGGGPTGPNPAFVDSHQCTPGEMPPHP